MKGTQPNRVMRSLTMEKIPDMKAVEWNIQKYKTNQIFHHQREVGKVRLGLNSRNKRGTSV